MAKRRTPRVTNMRPEAISPEQLDKLQRALGAITKAQTHIGMLEQEKHEYLHQIGSLQGLVDELREEFQETYGTTNIDLKDGTINYDTNS